ncbi:diguanylate cyclase [Geobacter sp. SVR]|uniref:diguanylate cyclase n=1 Tax=Geobacter sp. SVR TaxID=2495594 RepID=UPI00143EFCF7|nr:diguanylate cyclase [Geobacter sp. SVR]BCS52352.1 diguanylate cyclase response regulator [Geobacter sp. SVR]GCF84989.1 diguanylate cyclase response regulator [Geobacter sp. SVR]
MFDSVLIIDDSVAIRERIIKSLESFELFARYYEADDGLEGFKKLLASPVDIILCDLEMPRIDGFKFLNMLKSRPDLQDVPVIILTGMNDRELKVKGLEQGASDYITKPFDPEELVARVKVHLKIKHLQDDLKRTNELLLELSNTDHLTGMYNRRYLMEALDKEVQRSSRKGGNLSLILMDIDHFKQVNDTCGHLQGDVVLQKVALHLQKELRSYDIAARYGGEEFVAVLPDTSLEEAAFVAERVRASIRGIRFTGALSSLSITVSLGVATFTSPGCRSVDEFIKLADDALYRAKANGRDRVECSR